jgi:CubicO group peptidase (beta-lactamase class C family)
LTGRSFEKYLHEEFYQPLGIDNALFNPRKRYSPLEIVPTEEDRYFGMGVVHGYVHDEMAALLGGVSGNAGLFANAESLAPILQMLLNKGEYNGRRYFKRKTVREWTSCQFAENDNHRGIGFDKRRLNDTIPLEARTQKSLYYAPSASQESFGHSGFTGTMVWVDPKEDLIFIFLSNRVHPSRDEKSFFELNPRAKCHEAAYEAIRRHKRK